MPTIDANTTAADVANVIGAARSKAGWVSLVLFLIFLYPSAALCIKRRHDRNNNGLDVWIYFALVLVLQLISALGIGMLPGAAWPLASVERSALMRTGMPLRMSSNQAPGKIGRAHV